MFCSIYSFVNKEKSIFIKDSLISKGNLYFKFLQDFHQQLHMVEHLLQQPLLQQL